MPTSARKLRGRRFPSSPDFPSRQAISIVFKDLVPENTPPPHEPCIGRDQSTDRSCLGLHADS